jgi:hypothetical protein
MAAEIIYDDEQLRVVHQAGSSDFSLVTFGSLIDRPKEASFWGQQPATKLDIDVVGFVAKSDHWYPLGFIQSCLPAVMPRLRERRIGYGFSMGGYAALKCGSLLGLTHVLAASPQASINPADVPEDPRYHASFRPSLHADMRISADDVSGFAVQAADPYHRHDAPQATLIQATGRVHTLHAPFMAHAVVWQFAQTEMLRRTLDLLLAGDLAGLQNLLKAQRSRSAVWHRVVGQEAMRRGHGGIADRLWQRAAELGADPEVLLKDRAAGFEKRINLLLKRHALGDVEVAQVLAADAMALADDGLMFGRLGTNLAHHGCHDAAVPLLRRAIELLIRPGRS